jgi:hypothetical protein
MNKENAHLFLPLVQALIDGKTIQSKYYGDGKAECWEDFEDDDQIQFCDDPEDYRIKPEPRTFEIYVNKHTNKIYHQNWVDQDWELITVQEVME